MADKSHAVILDQGFKVHLHGRLTLTFIEELIYAESVVRIRKCCCSSDPGLHGCVFISLRFRIDAL